MADMNPATRVYQSQDPVVYTGPDEQKVHVLYGGQGSPDGPGHGHLVYGIPQDRILYDRPPGS
jgi:hypothetical protein